MWQREDDVLLEKGSLFPSHHSRRKINLLTIFVVGSLLLVSIALSIALVLVSLHASALRNNRVIDSEPSYTDKTKYSSFYVITDVHYEPYYENYLSCKSLCRSVRTNWTSSICSYDPITFENATKSNVGRYGCNSPQRLLSKTFESIKNKEKTDFVIAAGDNAAHGIADIENIEDGPEKVMQAIEYVSKMFKDTFPSTPVFPVLGNSDVPKQDYMMPIGEEGRNWLQRLYNIYEPLITCKHCDSSIKDQIDVDLSKFVSGGAGYYVVKKIPNTPKTRFIAYNNLLFNLKDDRKEIAKIIHEQFEWMETQLQEAKEAGDGVIISGHIPPGIQPKGEQPQWREDYTNRFISIIRKYHSNVIVQIYGHFHFESFRLLYDQNGNAISSVLIAPSVSPVFTNNPAYIQGIIQKKDGVFIDYFNYYLDLQGEDLQFKLQHNFKKAYNVDDLSPSSLDELYTRMFTKKPNKYLDGYIARQRGHYFDNSKQVECSMKHTIKEEMEECMRKADRKNED